MIMGTLWKIAVRNTLRHTRRTIITAVVMTAGIATFIFYDSVLSGMDRMAVDNLADYTVSSLRIQNPAYVEDIAAAPLDKGLPHPEAVLAALAAEGLPGTPRIRFVARLSNYEDEIPVMADAVDPVADASVFHVARSLTSGSWLTGAERNSVVLGAELAAELKVGVGDSIIVSAQTIHDTTNADDYTVTGLVRTPAPEVNRSGLFMALADARELLDAPGGGAAGGLVTEIDAAMPRAASLNAGLTAGNDVAARLRMVLPDAHVAPIGELAADYLALRSAKASYSYVIISIVLLIAGVGIVNTILMSVFSRVREIGVLRAYGMTARDILRLFTLEGLILGIIGSSLGVLCGVLLDILMIARGISLDSIGSSLMGSLPVGGVLHGEWNPVAMGIGFAFGITVSLVAARIPARKAARLEPTAALRFQ
jgi:ABC-type lipoprotein release transport system permease subunit